MTKLTREQIDAMTPDQMQLAVAEHVMKLEVVWNTNINGLAIRRDGKLGYVGPVYHVDADGNPCKLPDYPNDIAAAWQVKQKVSAEWEWFELTRMPNGKSRVNFTGNTGDTAIADTDEIAICKAALLAVREPQ